MTDVMMLKVHKVYPEQKIFVTTPEDTTDEIDLYVVYNPGGLSYSRLGFPNTGYRDEVARRTVQGSGQEEMALQRSAHPLLGQAPEQGH